MKKYIVYLVMALLVSVQSVWAIDLQAAKQKGLVGETPAGYLAAVQSTPEATQLVQNINAQRKKEYIEIAKRNNLELKSVEQLAGQKAIEKTPTGQFVQVNGTWVKK